MARYAQKVDSTSFLINMTTVLYLSRLVGSERTTFSGLGTIRRPVIVPKTPKMAGPPHNSSYKLFHIIDGRG